MDAGFFAGFDGPSLPSAALAPAVGSTDDAGAFEMDASGSVRDDAGGLASATPCMATGGSVGTEGGREVVRSALTNGAGGE